MRSGQVFGIGVVGLAVSMSAACGKKSSSDSANATATSATPANLPLITPPVKAATPAGFLTGSSLALTDSGIDAAGIKSRFFTAGPTYLFRILDDIDGFISGVNTQSAAQSIPCLSQDPVEYTISAFGQDETFYAQCYAAGTPTAKDPQLRQFGVKDGVIYLYAAYGAERVAAKVKPVAGQDGKYQVEAWIGVGYNNATFDSGSYGVVHLQADSSTNAFEMAVAGIGFGYCGVQLKSDGTNLYADGSADMGATCTAESTLCVLAGDLTTAGSCTDITTFALPALGREAASGAHASGVSQYPAAPNITLDGTTSDSLAFGPTTATAGVGNFADVAQPVVDGTDGTDKTK